jgi:hypothetical protein
MWSVLRAWWRRNPLVRTSDRIELMIIALGVLIALVATACAGALGTAVHDARSHVYLDEAHTRHTVIATAVEDSTNVFGVGDTAVTTANVRWQADGTTRTGGVTMSGPVRAGDPLVIWVDLEGNHVAAPTPTSQAGVDAIGVAYTAWQTALFIVIGLVCWGRTRVDRRRICGWERDLQGLVYGGGKHRKA